MSFYVYGLRLKGELECRYVGQTGKRPEDRLLNLKAQARHNLKIGFYAHPDGLNAWLTSNGDQVEVFAIAKLDTRKEALATERVVIALVLRLGHRLLNLDQVPHQQRIGTQRWGAGDKPRRKVAA